MNRGKKHRDPINPEEIDSLFLDHLSGPRPRSRTHESLQLVAVVSPKGGTGKTSIAIKLSGSMTTKQRSRAVMDLDPRGTARRWADAGRGLPFGVHNFESKRGGVAFRRALRNLTDDVDLLFIDTPPGGGAAARLAPEVADLVLIPAGASALDIEATRETLEAAATAGRLVRPSTEASREFTRLGRNLWKRIRQAPK